RRTHIVVVRTLSSYAGLTRVSLSASIQLRIIRNWTPMPQLLTRRRILAGAPLAAAAALGMPFIRRARADAREVNIYSGGHYPSDQTLFDMFEKETGIKVNAIQGVAEELIQRQQMEGDSSPADVLITVDAGNLWRAEQAALLQPIRSDLLEKE